MKKKAIQPEGEIVIVNQGGGDFLWNVAPINPEDLVWAQGFAGLMAREKKRYQDELKLAAIADDEYKLRGLTSERDGLFIMNKVAKAYPQVKWVLYQCRPVSTALMVQMKAGKIFRKTF